MSYKTKFQGLHENERETYFRAFGVVLGKVMYEIQGLQGQLESFQGFQGF